MFEALYRGQERDDKGTGSKIGKEESRASECKAKVETATNPLACCSFTFSLPTYIFLTTPASSVSLTDDPLSRLEHADMTASPPSVLQITWL